MDSKEMAPGDIERRSFEIITEELPPLEEPVVKRVIHTTADFSYADSLVFTHDAAHCALDALRAGATVLTDTNMALAGISKPALAKLGCKAVCYMADPDVAVAARAAGTTRAVASMDKACGIEGPLIVAVGNAPTALLRLAELMDEGKIAPALVVGVPVGFVNVVEAKEELLARRAPAIVARGGGRHYERAALPDHAPRRPEVTAPASAPALRIFAGTTEGRLLCEWASGAGIPARAYAATEYGGELLGELPGIEVHAGRLDEADMERELSGARIVVDATHPFATLASGNIRAASLAVGARCLRLARPAEALPKGVVPVASIACAARFLSENPGRALLTTGSKELAPYTRVADFADRFFVRVLPLPGAITKCIDAGFSPSHVIGMQGPFTRELNEAMLRQVGAQWLVTKDSGTVGGTAEKIASAHDVGARCIVVARPAEGGGALSLREVKDALLREFAR